MEVGFESSLKNLQIINETKFDLVCLIGDLLEVSDEPN